MKKQQFEQIVRKLQILILGSSDEDMETVKDSKIDTTATVMRPSTEELELMEFEQIEAMIAEDEKMMQMQKGK